MKKTMSFLLLGAFIFSSAAFADSSAAGNTAGKQAGEKISCFFQKLNPMPFFKEQKKRYDERKAASGK